ncbi:MAG: hypothetical protein K8R54_18710 [Bacteroidales bacterium]|nr:hypothetical protein [Bacteroidales bacterium]
MAQENLISLNIPEEDKAEIKAAVAVLVGKLLPHLKALSPEERHTLPKAGDKTIAFLEKTKEFFESNGELVPAFIDKDEYYVDLNGMNELHEYHTPINQLASMLNDSMLLTGSEAYVTALAYYKSVKSAAKLNIPGAKEIYEELRKRFKGK